MLKKSRQRDEILSYLKSVNTHPTAETIYMEVKKAIPDISLATVYRNLKLLSENGEILELTYGSSSSRFDGNTSPHYHFVCEKCKNVYDIMMDLTDELHSMVTREGYLPYEHRLEFFGVCKDCCQKLKA